MSSTTPRYPRRTLLSWCLGALAVRAAPAQRSLGTDSPPAYRDLEKPVVLSWEALSRSREPLAFEARLRSDATTDPVILEGVALRGERRREAHAFCTLCPHEICQVEYDPDPSRTIRQESPPGRPLFVCPCHFSAFDPRAGGALLGGPALRGLYRFLTRSTPDAVEITQVEEGVLEVLGHETRAVGAIAAQRLGPKEEP